MSLAPAALLALWGVLFGGAAAARDADAAPRDFQSFQLAGLRAALARYRAIERAGGWPVLEPGTALREGDQGPEAVRLRRRLALEDRRLEAAPVSRVFDAALARGLRRFQASHGLHATGLLDEATLQALNTPVSTRIGQIEETVSALGRWRQAPDRPFVLVDLPQQRLAVVVGTRTVMRMDVVVGRPESATPELDSRIERIAVNPSWDIPPGPALELALAGARADRGYLDSLNIQVLKPGADSDRELDPREVDWGAASTTTFRLVLRQQPGPANPLGRLKFVFPNEHNVYLHDTPLKELFGLADRRKSLGCVRVEKAFELAAWLLAADPRWPPRRLASAIREGGPRTIWLDAPVDLHIVSWPVLLDDRGRVGFPPPLP